MSLWDDVARGEYDAFVWLGDAVYADERVRVGIGRSERVYKGEEAHARAYARVKAHPGYARVRATADVKGTWDDHDYGFNNAGKHWSAKEFAREAFLDFLDEPRDSERRVRDGGIWDSVDYVSPNGRRARLILLDLRWDLEESDEKSGGVLMSEKQWTWFEEQLRAEPRPEVTIIGSGIQVLEAPHLLWRPLAFLGEFARGISEGLENWSRMPHEKRRLFKTIERHGANVMFISGDVHHGQISVAPSGCHLPYKTIDATSSGLTHTPFRDAKPWPLGLIMKAITPSHFRKWILPSHDRWTDINYGEVEIDWDAGAVAVRIKGPGGATVLEESMLLSEFNETEPAFDRDQEGCNAILDMTPNMRAFTMIRFFSWLLSVYVAQTLGPIVALAWAYRALTRRCAPHAKKE